MPDSSYLLPALVVGVLLCALHARVNVYGAFVSGAGRFTFAGNALTLAVVAVSAAVMAVFVWLAEKKNAAWVDNFSIAGSMLAGMAAAVLLRGI